MAGRKWDVLGGVAALVGFSLLLWRHRHFFHDDAYISLRYARNFAEHGVLEWNIGERVEGYTNFLHVPLTSGLLMLGLPPEGAVRLIGLFAALLLGLSVFLTLRRLEPQDGRYRAATLVTLGLTPGIAIWVLGGLETLMVAAFLTLGTYYVVALLQDARTRLALFAGLAFSVAVLTRMDAAIFIAATGLSVLLFAPGRFGPRFGQAFLVAGLPGLVSFGHMAWRLHYYGLAFPLTFYAKADTPFELRASFIEILPTYVMFGFPIWPIAVVAAVAGLFKASGGSPMVRALALPFLLASAYVLWSGGDHMPGSRVFLPLAGLALFVVVSNLTVRHMLIPVMLVTTLVASVMSPAERMDGAAFFGSLAADRINEVLPKGITIALSTAGSTPFLADGRVYIDMLGLNDRHIALRQDVPILTEAQKLPGHAKGDGAYVLSREPDIIILGPALGTTYDKPSFLSDVELANLPEFHRCYHLVEARIEITPEQAAITRAPRMVEPVYWYERRCPKTGG